MKRFVLKLWLAGLLLIAVAGTPVALRAQVPGIPVGTNKLANQTLPFRGKLKAIDLTAKTITIGERTIQITSETIISKSSQPAMLSDVAEGDMVAGSYKKDADGKLEAVTLRLAPKPQLLPSETKTNKTNIP